MSDLSPPMLKSLTPGAKSLVLQYDISQTWNLAGAWSLDRGLVSPTFYSHSYSAASSGRLHLWGHTTALNLCVPTQYVPQRFCRGCQSIPIFEVGPFSIPIVKLANGVVCHANDLNPSSIHWLLKSVELNKLPYA